MSQLGFILKQLGVKITSRDVFGNICCPLAKNMETLPVLSRAEALACESVARRELSCQIGLSSRRRLGLGVMIPQQLSGSVVH
jgi:hypothetical protein